MDDELIAPEPEAPKRGRLSTTLKKILLIAAPLLLVGAGGAWWLFGAGAEVAAESHEVAIAERGVVPFETFLVNLTDPGGNRFLKITLQLGFESEAAAKHVEENAALVAHLRSAILELLAEQSAPRLVTVEGKQALKDGIRTRIAAILKDPKVIDVLFSEFVVQF